MAAWMAFVFTKSSKPNVLYTNASIKSNLQQFIRDIAHLRKSGKYAHEQTPLNNFSACMTPSKCTHPTGLREAFCRFMWNVGCMMLYEVHECYSFLEM